MSLAPFIVGIGGTTTAPSSTERALMIALAAAEQAGARVKLFGDAFLSRLPHYRPNGDVRSAEERELIEAVRQANGLLIASPGYHGGVSGLVKNALDLLQETASDARPYLTGVPVGLIATAYGWQALGGAVASLRATVHALRGWPTPLAATVNCQATPFAEDGSCPSEKVREQLELVGRQVVEFLHERRGSAGAEVHRPASL